MGYCGHHNERITLTIFAGSRQSSLFTMYAVKRDLTHIIRTKELPKVNRKLRIITIGAGVSGILMAYKIQSVRCLEVVPTLADYLALQEH